MCCSFSLWGGKKSNNHSRVIRTCQRSSSWVRKVYLSIVELNFSISLTFLCGFQVIRFGQESSTCLRRKSVLGLLSNFIARSPVLGQLKFKLLLCQTRMCLLSLEGAIFSNNCHQFLPIAVVAPHFSYLWATLENSRAMFRDNECAYSAQYNALKTIPDFRFLILFSMKNLKRMQVWKWR